MKKNLFVLLITVFILSIFLSGCLPNKIFHQLVGENRKIVTENQELLVDLFHSQKRVEQLEMEIAELLTMSGEFKAQREKELADVTKTYDNLVDGLKKEVQSGKIEIEQIRGSLTMSIAEEIFFDLGEAEITPEGQEVLKRIGKILKEIPEKNIRIEGHTDNLPIGSTLREKYPTNWDLGAARAVNVIRFLQNNARIDPLRLSAVSYGQYRPVASNKTKAGRAKNRRIEIILIDRNLDLAKRMKQNLAP
jgi:chemotaxis protein MotB